MDAKTRVFLAQDSHNTDAMRILEENCRRNFEVVDLKVIIDLVKLFDNLCLRKIRRRDMLASFQSLMT